MIAKEMMQLMCESLDEDRLFYDWVLQDKLKLWSTKGKA